MKITISYMVLHPCMLINCEKGIMILFLLQEPDPKMYGHRPKNAAQLLQKFDLPRERAYTEAVDIIMEDPRYRICEIAWCAGGLYTLCCWQAAKEVEMTYQKVDGEHVLLYSKALFRWKDSVPPDQYKLLLPNKSLE